VELIFGVFPVPDADRQDEVIAQVLLADRLGLDIVGVQDHPYQRRYRLRGAHGGPSPAHDIGIWLGAYGPRMMRMVGRLADGWISSLPPLPLEEVPGRQALIDESARRAGRDPARIGRLANINGAITDGAHDGWLRGPVDHCVEELVRLARELGFDGFILWPDHPDVLGQTERFATDVVPQVRRAMSRAPR